MEFPMDIIITTASTLLGTLLGFLLNYMGEFFGKLSINIEFLQKEVRRIPRHNITTDKNTGYITEKEYLGDQVYHLGLTFFLVVYNGKRIQAGINNCRFYIISKSANTKVVLGSNFSKDSNIDESGELLNIMARTAKRIQISKELIYVPNNIEEGFKLYMSYTVVGKSKEYHKKLYECNSV